MQFQLEAFASQDSRAQGEALVDRSCVREDLATLFDPHAQAGKLLLGGRGSAWQVTGSFGSAALRHYRRGGLLAALRKDRYWFRSAEQTRGFRELRLLSHLYALGLPVPRPLAARYARLGRSYQADLLTSWLPAARPLAELGAQADSAMFSAVGRCIAQFHRAGVWHADLNAHNIVFTEQRIALLDFDRGELRAVAARWQQANLQRLERSLRKLGFAQHPDFAARWMPALHSAHALELSA